MIGQRWTILRVAEDAHGNRRGDGDTCWLIRSTTQHLGDKPFIVADEVPVSVRLVWVDTPERGKPGWAQATADLSHWLDAAAAAGPLTVWVYPDSAGWDRLLGDVYDADGNSASQYMMIDRGWPAYVKGT